MTDPATEWFEVVEIPKKKATKTLNLFLEHGMVRMLIKDLTETSLSIKMALYDVRMEEFKIILMQLPIMNRRTNAVFNSLLDPGLNSFTRTVGNGHRQSR